MAKKVFTDESLSTFVDEIKAYTDDKVATKANSSHNHAASNITSGTLSSDRLPTVPISKGGTGATTAASALTNLGITATATELNYVDGVTSNIQTQLNGKAASSHNHSASNITSGTLPIARGGTGATTAASALTNLGITATATEINKLDGITATTTELNYTDGVTSNIQTQLDGKASSSHTHSYLPLSGGTMTGTITTKTGAGISAKGNNGSWSNGRTISNAAIYFPTASVTDGSRYDPLLAGETIDGYVWNIGAGATSQMGFYGYKKSDTDNATLWSATFNPSTGKFTSTANIKAPKFEGALSGNATTATTATKLDTSAGSATQPIYFSGGKPVAITYTLAKSVPSNAVFTDTDTKVTQGVSTSEKWRSILTGYTQMDSGAETVAAETNQAYKATGVAVQPSTGALRAKSFNVNDNVSLVYDSTNKCLNFNFS